MTLLIAGVAFGQFTHLNGHFPVNNYTNDDFNSPVQMWTGTQTAQGIFVFGNDKKIISFNGDDWSFVELDTSFTSLDTTSIKHPSDKIEEKKVYKLFAASDSSIYVSRENSLGKLDYDKQGRLRYYPFYYDSTLVNVWYIYESSEGSIIYTSSDRIISYNPSTGEIKTPLTKEHVNNGEINSSVQFDDKLLLGVSYENKENFDKKNGQFFIFDFANNGSIQPIKTEENRKNYQFRASFHARDTNFFMDYMGRIFSIDRKYNVLKERFTLKRNGQTKSINTASLIKHKNYLWVATTNHGIEIYDLHGKLIREFGEVEGLQDLNVFSLFFDKDDNLWLNLDNGIANIEFSSPTALWDRNQGLEGAAEAMIIEDEKILIATRAGIFNSYYSSTSNRALFKNAKVTEESCFDIKSFETDYGKRTLIVGYNGIYEITSLETKAKSIGSGLYGWELYQSPLDRNVIYLGGEGFLGRFKITEAGWNYKEIESFPGTTIRKFESKNEKIYFSVYDQGIYVINKNEETRKLNIADGIKTERSHFYLTSFKGDTYAGYTYGLLKIKGDSLIQTSAQGIDFEGTEMNIHRLYSHPQKEELWAVIFDETDKDRTKKEIGYFIIKGDSLHWISLNNNSLESGVVMDIQYHDNLLYFATTEGLLVFDREKLKRINDPWNVYISSIRVNDSIAVYNPEHARPLGAIPYGRSIRFNFAGNSFSNNGEIMYRTRIIELSEDWSKYELTNFKNIDNLPHGTYTLEVQGKNYHNTESKVYRYKFTILPPWYFTWWAYIIYFFLFILIIIITTRISVYRVRQKNKQLEEIVHERTREIAEQNTMLEDQKNQIAAKNEDILDSIKYAKRIQNTILPSEQLLSSCFKDHFVFYRPKDIVSGDFYWMRQVGDKVLWSAVDCTGHGVPGAFVSIVGNNSLVRTVNEFKLEQPNLILDKLRELVVEAFKAQGERDVKDGMDLALLSLDPKTNELMYAGANNPLVIIRNKEIIEIKADKQPVGDFERSFPFTNHVIQLQEGDSVYVFSDGYVDQFGGPKGKKLKSKPFRKLLTEISELPMKEQLSVLNQHFDEWKGDLEQLDDVCVFGVRI